MKTKQQLYINQQKNIKMKKLNIIILAIASVTLFSCGKDNMQPTNPQTPSTATTVTKQDVQFDENNSKLITWNELPENLKNAEMFVAEKTRVLWVKQPLLT